MKKSDLDQPATKRDIKRALLATEKRIVDGVSENINQALQLVADQFTAQNKILATKADKTDITRLENKLDPTIDAVDDHNVRIRQLETKTA